MKNVTKKLKTSFSPQRWNNPPNRDAHVSSFCTSAIDRALSWDVVICSRTPVMPILKKVSSRCVLEESIVLLMCIIPAVALSGQEFRSKARTCTGIM